MDKVAIKTEKLSKVYKLYDNISDRLKETVHPFRKKYHHDFYALKNIDLEINRGQTLGIIGKNGSGKSTLLKILCGVLTPTSGGYHVNGRISSLLELGAGFNPELSGIENVIFNGAILGFSRQEMDEKINKIIEFADIGEYLNQLVKTYSTGMAVRLAFSVAINTDPDVLIIDEALAVGDMRFQQKCFRKIKEFKKEGKTIIFVSHDLGAVTNFCDKVLWLDKGEIVTYGNPGTVCKEYSSYMWYDAQTETKMEGATQCASFGEGGAKILKTGLFSDKGEGLEILKGDEFVDFSVEVLAQQDIENPIVGFVLNDVYGNAILGTNSFISGIKLPSLKKGKKYKFIFKFKIPELKNGQYSFSPAIAEGTQDAHVQHHWVHDACLMRIMNNDRRATMGWYFLLKDPSIIMLDN